MDKTTNKNILTDELVALAKKNQKSISDGGGGLYLCRNKNQWYWRYSYFFNGRRTTVGLGSYPGRSIQSARALAQNCKIASANGIDVAIAIKNKKYELYNSIVDF